MSAQLIPAPEVVAQREGELRRHAVINVMEGAEHGLEVSLINNFQYLEERIDRQLSGVSVVYAYGMGGGVAIEQVYERLAQYEVAPLQVVLTLIAEVADLLLLCPQLHGGQHKLRNVAHKEHVAQYLTVGGGGGSDVHVVVTVLLFVVIYRHYAHVWSALYAPYGQSERYVG